MRLGIYERHSLGRRGRFHELSPMCTIHGLALVLARISIGFLVLYIERMGMTNVGVFVLTIIGVFIFV